MNDELPLAYHEPVDHPRPCFPRPDAETYRGAEWPDEELKRWIQYYERERAASIEAANDRTAGTTAYCDFKLDAMLDELVRRKNLARKFTRDPRGPRWSTAGERDRSDLIAFALELKGQMPIDQFLTELMGAILRPSGQDRWTCRCVSGIHKDSNPSMSVYGSDNHVHCYGCGYTGDIFDLAMLTTGNPSFREAVRFVADALGLGREVAS